MKNYHKLPFEFCLSYNLYFFIFPTTIFLIIYVDRWDQYVLNLLRDIRLHMSGILPLHVSPNGRKAEYSASQSFLILMGKNYEYCCTLI